MKLAIVSPFFPEISGVGQYGVRVAGGLALTGRFSEITVLANLHPGGAAVETWPGLRVERCWRRDHLSTLPNVWRALERLRPDVVWFNLGLSIYGSSPIANFVAHLAPALAQTSGLRTVVTLHELFDFADLQGIGAADHRVMRWGGALATRMILRAHQTCFTLKSYGQWAVDKYRARNVWYIPHGTFDAPCYTPIPAEGRILFFGLQAPYKGLPGLLAIYRRLRAADPTLCLTVAGSDHPRFPGYSRSVQDSQANLAGVTWRGHVPEDQLPALFESARVVALPYTAATGASSVIHRAAAHGRPVVAYALRDLKTLAADEGLKVLFVPAGDQAAFAACLDRMLHDPAECERTGLFNVRAMQAYTLESTCQRYIEVFERALDGAPA
jgi:glycosyltransferase involved in cell wall biosynthesis